MKTILLISQSIVSILLIVFILLQQRGTALGSSFGGDSGFYSTRRGVEKKIFILTIVFGALFIMLAIANLVV